MKSHRGSSVLEDQGSIDSDLLKVISSAFADVHANIVFDLPDNQLQLSAIPKLPDDVSVLQRISPFFQRELQVQAGVYVICRPSPENVPSVDFQDPWESTFDLLDRVASSDPIQLTKMINGGVDCAGLDPQAQSLVASYYGGQSKAIQGAIDGTPINVSIEFSPTITKKGRNGYWQNAQIGDGSTFGASPIALPSNASKRTPFVQSPSGNLSFGEGEVITLNNLGARVKEKLGIECAIDTRVGDSKIFIKGTYTKERMAAALKLLGGSPTVAVATAETRPSIQERERKILEKLLDRVQGIDPSKKALLKNLVSQGYMAATPQNLAQLGFSAGLDAGAGARIQLNLVLSMSSLTASYTDQNGVSHPLPQTFNLVLQTGPP